LKRHFGIPWVADFRDPWTDNRIHYRRISGVRKALDRRLERRIYGLADAVIANTEMNRKTLIDGHQVEPHRAVTIPNGYDEADFDGVAGEQPDDFYRVTYCGSAYANYNPKAFGEILRRFLREFPHARIRWTFAGGSSQWASESECDLMADRRLELLGYVPHDRIPQLLMSSNLLLHVYPRNLEYSVPGKLYEYLRSGTPILAICDRPSEVERILQETGRGRVFAHQETEGAVRWLAERYAEWESGDAVGHEEPNEQIRSYERRDQTRRLAELLRSVANLEKSH